MYGYLGDYETLIARAKELQDHIETFFQDKSAHQEIPQVIVSLGQCVATIAVDEIEVWHSEVDPLDITLDYMITKFTERCQWWAQFSNWQRQ